MAEHLTFDFTEPAVPRHRAGHPARIHLPPTIDERFDAFHAANPWVYDALVKLARVLVVDRGYRRIGIGMLFEVLRWSWMQTNDPLTEWKLNNDLRSRYARLIMATEADLAGCFETRELKGS